MSCILLNYISINLIFFRKKESVSITIITHQTHIAEVGKGRKQIHLRSINVEQNKESTGGSLLHDGLRGCTLKPVPRSPHLHAGAQRVEFHAKLTL
jgi:hypothetical protein